MSTRPPSDPDYWYDPDTTGIAALRQIRQAEEYRPAPIQDAMETTAEERARAKARGAKHGADWVDYLLRDIDRALAEIARLTAINADLLKVNLSHAEAIARIAELEVERDKLKAALDEAQKQVRLFNVEITPRHQP